MVGGWSALLSVPASLAGLLLGPSMILASSIIQWTRRFFFFLFLVFRFCIVQWGEVEGKGVRDRAAFFDLWIADYDN